MVSWNAVYESDVWGLTALGRAWIQRLVLRGYNVEHGEFYSHTR